MGLQRYGVGTLWGDGFLQFRLQKCNISIGFVKVLQNRAGVPVGKKSPKGDFLPNNHHDNVI